MGAKLSGSSGKKYGIEQNADINVTPFVDVMLVLLIIFMVAAPLATQSLRIDLPPPAPPTKDKPKPLVLVQVLEDGSLWVGIKDGSQAKVEMDNLVNGVYSAWSAAGLAGNDRRVSIRTGAHVKYGRFMAVLNTLEKAGITNVNLALEGAAQI
jgi:biopolymer transport protein ExbD